MSEELEKSTKAIESFKNYIKSIEDETEFYYKQDEEYYRDVIEQNELILKMLYTVLNYIDNSISKEVVEKKIEAYSKHCTVINSFIVEVLQELLEGK